ncbi:MAG: hypothetical protein KJ072_25540 [Verrucomicrobia bacterium]|nr:hypothetical protein [Verrucomicrobiota bacterium]
MKHKTIRYTLGGALGLAVLAALILNQSTTSAWAIEQAIEALEKYNAVRMTGATTAGGPAAPAELWARADATGSRSAECLARSDSFTAWVKDNKTYVYDHARNTVLVEPAITMGLNPWLGPKFLTTLSKLPNYNAVEGADPATGQKRILVTASLESATGPQSFLIEFDATTKLPVTMTHWLNLDRRGAPDFSFDKIVYFEDLPDSAFQFEPPAGVSFVEKPLTIPDANLPMLSNPKSGISAEGLTREEACRRLLEQFWSAVLNDDLARIRQLCPVTATWPDRLLLDLMAEDEAVELLRIGPIEKEGQSRLGALALVPSRIRCSDGRVREVNIIVQFRETDQGASCVVHGNYGHTVVVE